MKIELLNNWPSESEDFVPLAILAGWDRKNRWHSQRCIYFGICILGIGFSIKIPFTEKI